MTATDVAEFLEQAEPVDVRTLARDGMPEALDGLHRRIGHDTDRAPHSVHRDDPRFGELLVAAVGSAANSPGESRAARQHSRANRQFEPREHANRV